MKATPSSSYVTQKKYSYDLLLRFGLQNYKFVLTLAALGPSLQANKGSPLVDSSQYRSLVGVLQYLTISHPYIAYAIYQVCKYMHTLTNLRWVAAKCVLCYVKGSLDVGLTFRPFPSTTLNVLVFSNWAGDLDDRKSTTTRSCIC